jgi:hypothetical protein
MAARSTVRRQFLYSFKKKFGKLKILKSLHIIYNGGEFYDSWLLVVTAVFAVKFSQRWCPDKE